VLDFGRSISSWERKNVSQVMRGCAGVIFNIMLFPATTQHIIWCLDLIRSDPSHAYLVLIRGTRISSSLILGWKSRRREKAKRMTS
jgi:hypothetical protein